MKSNRNILCLAVVSIYFIACNGVGENPISNNSINTIKTITCISDNSSDTKTAYNNNDNGTYTVTWSKGDALAVTTAGASDVVPTLSLTSFNLKSGENTNVGVFESETTLTGDFYSAVYPASAASVSEADQNYIAVQFPSIQNYVADGIAEGIIPMYGVGSDPSAIPFVYGSGVIRLNLYSESSVKINKIEIITDISASGKLLAKARNNRFPFASFAVDRGNTTITYNVPDVALSTSSDSPTQFNIAVAASSHCGSSSDTRYYKTFKVKIYANDGSEMLKEKTNFTVIGGKIHNFPVTKFEPDATTYAVGDYWPNKENAEGVVFEVSNGGINGKILGLVERASLQFSTTNNIDGTNDENDGSVNIATVKAIDDGFLSYPVFAWVSSLGRGEWYIPAQEELKKIHDLMNSEGSTTIKRNQFNSKFTEVGGVGLTFTYVDGKYPCYYSSTEDPANAGRLLGVRFDKAPTAPERVLSNCQKKTSNTTYVFWRPIKNSNPK